MYLPYHGIQVGYVAHLSCEYHFHPVLFYSTFFQPNGTTENKQEVCQLDLRRGKAMNGKNSTHQWDRH